MYNNYKKGLLPDPGSLYQQSSVYLECMNIIDNTINECERLVSQQKLKDESLSKRHTNNRQKAASPLQRVGKVL